MAWNQEKPTRTGLRVQVVHSSVLSHMSSPWVYWTKFVEFKMFKINIFPMHYTMYHISLYHSKHILEMIKKLKLGRRSQSLVKVMVQRSVALDLACFLYFSTTHEFSLCELCKCSKVSDNMSMIPLIFWSKTKPSLKINLDHQTWSSTAVRMIVIMLMMPQKIT